MVLLHAAAKEDAIEFLKPSTVADGLRTDDGFWISAAALMKGRISNAVSLKSSRIAFIGGVFPAAK